MTTQLLQDFYTQLQPLKFPLSCANLDEISFELTKDNMEKIETFFNNNYVLLSLITGITPLEHVHFDYTNVCSSSNQRLMFHVHSICTVVENKVKQVLAEN